jgi:hypothetical protein
MTVAAPPEFDSPHVSLDAESAPPTGRGTWVATTVDTPTAKWTVGGQLYEVDPHPRAVAAALADSVLAAANILGPEAYTEMHRELAHRFGGSHPDDFVLAPPPEPVDAHSPIEVGHPDPLQAGELTERFEEHPLPDEPQVAGRLAPEPGPVPEPPRVEQPRAEQPRRSGGGGRRQR